MFQSYIISSGLLGFYRGWIADYRYNSFTKEHSRITYSLYAERFAYKTLRGLFNATMYATFGNPMAIYKSICRTEIEWTGKNRYDYSHAYVEVLNYTTLPPPHDEK